MAVDYLWVNLGAGLVKVGTGVNLPAPMTVEWFDEGQDGVTEAGTYYTFKKSAVKLTWENISLAHFNAMVDFWKSAQSVRYKATQIRVNADDDGTWKTYSRLNNRGIRMDRPIGAFEGPIVPRAEWTFREVKRSID